MLTRKLVLLLAYDRSPALPVGVSELTRLGGDKEVVVIDDCRYFQPLDVDVENVTPEVYSIATQVV